MSNPFQVTGTDESGNPLYYGLSGPVQRDLGVIQSGALHPNGWGVQVVQAGDGSYWSSYNGGTQVDPSTLPAGYLEQAAAATRASQNELNAQNQASSNSAGGDMVGTLLNAGVTKGLMTAFTGGFGDALGLTTMGSGFAGTAGTPNVTPETATQQIANYNNMSVAPGTVTAQGSLSSAIGNASQQSLAPWALDPAATAPTFNTSLSSFTPSISSFTPDVAKSAWGASATPAPAAITPAASAATPATNALDPYPLNDSGNALSPVTPADSPAPASTPSLSTLGNTLSTAAKDIYGNPIGKAIIGAGISAAISGSGNNSGSNFNDQLQSLISKSNSTYNAPQAVPIPNAPTALGAVSSGDSTTLGTGAIADPYALLIGSGKPAPAMSVTAGGGTQNAPNMAMPDMGQTGAIKLGIRPVMYARNGGMVRGCK